MKLKILVILSLSLLIFSFQQKGNLELTFKNDTNEDFKNLEVNVRGKIYNFSNIKKGQKTKPIKVESSYKYCYAKAITLKDTLTCSGFCSVGEKLFIDGKLLITFQFEKGNESKFLIIEPDKREE
ncbi:hypothetical protein [Flavobacterium sp. 3HN19-14]|uniref:hypothetical protein n=1 Tax=Flavobacterium sp. 3HN19-14 TaxID=3448133 RepID=UPI003EDE8D25